MPCTAALEALALGLVVVLGLVLVLALVELDELELQAATPSTAAHRPAIAAGSKGSFPI
jgi:hypothetical protein